MGKFNGKTCVYCGREKSSELGEHVVSKEFFLVRDRNKLPKVPACGQCNTQKSQHENYVLTVLPIASEHQDAPEYAVLNLFRRLNGNRALARSISLIRSSPWLDATGEKLEFRDAISVDFTHIQRLLEYIVRGLYAHHMGEILPQNYGVMVSAFTRAKEITARGKIRDGVVGSGGTSFSGNLGRGTFLYDATLRPSDKFVSFWRFSIFGGAEFNMGAGYIGPGISNIYAITIPIPGRNSIS